MSNTAIFVDPYGRVYSSPQEVTADSKRKQHNLKRKHSIQEQFEHFHRENPRIYDLFVHYAYEAKNAGFEQYGIQSIAERIRWHIDVETSGEKFKINNSYLSRYARLIEEQEPDLRGFFRTRPIRTR